MESADDIFADTEFVGTMYPVYLKMVSPRKGRGDGAINETVTAAVETGHDGAIIAGAVDNCWIRPQVVEQSCDSSAP
jgi:hypothetical protein